MADPHEHMTLGPHFEHMPLYYRLTGSFYVTHVGKKHLLECNTKLNKTFEAVCLRIGRLWHHERRRPTAGTT